MSDRKNITRVKSINGVTIASGTYGENYYVYNIDGDDIVIAEHTSEEDISLAFWALYNNSDNETEQHELYDYFVSILESNDYVPVEYADGNEYEENDGVLYCFESEEDSFLDGFNFGKYEANLYPEDFEETEVDEEGYVSHYGGTTYHIDSVRNDGPSDDIAVEVPQDEFDWLRKRLSDVEHRLRIAEETDKYREYNIYSDVF